ncbi:uncharacterized protein TRIADDRAFT_55388 [Trichoplax adhaerens]|uniref:UDP-xylose and UDP-N-acetylglucosamine transporter n=1 Tax=Trichoplax adhaerens TaxID=10228 RepID=B3RUR9_TRIAD|nr:hypothetical protein TRIADDRAFT_55388 [Trichoplax adhaerens]EDV25870.1 hypothetical protein TRIADDRAFT_55388 [Trichoplax adhaerens]|eukprot:XP_002111903.1 hypothetical protein TRIADDRAFT_55388 [Trichoplax adhaerens]
MRLVSVYQYRCISSLNRCGSLLANMTLGILLLKKSYSKSTYAAVVAVTIGISMCTMASVSAKTAEASDKAQIDSDLHEMTIGTIMVFIALFTSAYLGIQQEQLYKKYGKHPKEALFYTHLLPLPAFLLLQSDIRHHINIFSQPPYANFSYMPENGFTMLWFLLFCNVITQYPFNV